MHTLIGIDFDEFVRFVFDHPAFEGEEYEVEDGRIVRRLQQPPREWYWELDPWEIATDGVEQLMKMSRLMRAPEFLAERFTPRQIAQGFTFLFGPGGDELFTRHLWRADLSWAVRAEFIGSTVPLYARLFDRHPQIGHVPFMLWDMLLGFRFEEGYEPVEGGCEAADLASDRERIQGAVLEALEGLFALDGCWSVPAALHGAHHVNHPRALDMVRTFVEREPDPGDEWYEYALCVLRGEVM